MGEAGAPIVMLNSVDEVRALHRMLMDRKFDGPDDEYFGSPFIARIQHRLADALTAAEPGKDWAVWRDASGHVRELERVRAHIAGLGAWWANAAVVVRQQYVRDLLAPLLVDDDLLRELTV